MGNGLIFALVVALWAAYFVPLALRRYDEATKSTTVDKLSALTRVVTGPQAKNSDEDEENDVATTDVTPETEPTKTTHEKPETVGAEASTPRVTAASPDSAPTPRTEASSSPEPSPAPRAAKASREPGPAPRMNAEAHRTAARRRRNVLLTLFTALAATIAPAALGVLEWIYVAIPAGLIVVWLIACRVMVRGELGISRRSAEAESGPQPKKRLFASAPAEAADVSDPEDAEDTVIITDHVAETDPSRPHVMESARLDSDDLSERLNIAVPVSSMSGDALWDPLPVTVPTYVTKPRAGRTVRTVQLGEPGVWTSGHVEGEDIDFPTATPADASRAVGE